MFDGQLIGSLDREDAVEALVRPADGTGRWIEAEKAAKPSAAVSGEGAEQEGSPSPIDLSGQETQAAPAAEEPTPSSSF